LHSDIQYVILYIGTQIVEGLAGAKTPDGSFLQVFSTAELLRGKQPSMRDVVDKLWPEIEWIKDIGLREQTARTWGLALERTPLKAEDLLRIPFTLLIKNCEVTFMHHKRCVVHIARRSAEAMQEFMGRMLPLDMDVVIAGAILADVGKLLEYKTGPNGEVRQSEIGKMLRHPFTGVALALECGVPPPVCHVIATHAAEGGLVARTPEAWVVHHADFMAFDPFKDLANRK
jgi:putative nucleotidyltransferase with HDIG domain